MSNIQVFDETNTAEFTSTLFLAPVIFEMLANNFGQIKHEWVSRIGAMIETDCAVTLEIMRMHTLTHFNGVVISELTGLHMPEAFLSELPGMAKMLIERFRRFPVTGMLFEPEKFQFLVLGTTVTFII